MNDTQSTVYSHADEIDEKPIQTHPHTFCPFLGILKIIFNTIIYVLYLLEKKIPRGLTIDVPEFD